MTDRSADLPLLWHLKVSNYNEKARWALDYKRFPHRRKAVMPGLHRRIAKRLSGGRTFPVLVLDGRAIGDSTEIIAELERRQPYPPLYPEDPRERRHALDLEEFFDEELGPYSRMLGLHHMSGDADLFGGAFAPDLHPLPRAIARVAFPLTRRRLVADFGLDQPGIALAYSKLRAAGERFVDSAGPRGYLVGDSFSVADLTLAALISPLVAPKEFPYPQPQRDHPLLAEPRRALAEFGLVEWTREMYARHRGTSAEVDAAAQRAAVPAESVQV
jgi:glutathione S-transferase